jgi:hypothetical protein
LLAGYRPFTPGRGVRLHRRSGDDVVVADPNEQMGFAPPILQSPLNAAPSCFRLDDVVDVVRRGHSAGRTHDSDDGRVLANADADTGDARGWLGQRPPKLREAFGDGAVPGPTAPLLADDQARVDQDLEVVRHGGLGAVQRLDQLAHTRLARWR